MKKTYWQILGYDGTEKIFEKVVPLGYFSEKQIKCLLKAMAAKTGLNFEEMVGAYAKRGSRITNELLSVNRYGSHPIFTCGTNPHFVAKVVPHHDL